MTNDRPERERVEPTADDLKALGYAPGHYIPMCCDCTHEQRIDGRFADKRAWRCEEHARAAWNQRAALRPADGLVEVLGEIADDMDKELRHWRANRIREAATALRSQPDPHPGYSPCPRCGQYSHTLTEDRITDALMHFTAMTDHRGDGIGTQHVFDDKTRDAAQVLAAAAKGEWKQ